MLLLLLTLLTTQTTDDSDSGSIWIRTEPGVVVYLNGVKAGVSNLEQGGLWLHRIKPGIHEIRVEVPGGGSSTMKVQVETGEAVKVPVSSLGIRANDIRRMGELEIRVTAPRGGCLVKLGDRRRALGSSPVLFHDVAAGKQRVVVTCGSRTFQQDIDIPAGHSILVDADLVNGAFRVAEDRPLRTQVDVKTTRDEIMKAPISATAKRLLIASLEPNIVVLDVSEALGKVTLQVEAPSATSASNFVERVKKRPEVNEIKVDSMTMKNTRAVIRLIFSVR